MISWSSHILVRPGPQPVMPAATAPQSSRSWSLVALGCEVGEKIVKNMETNKKHGKHQVWGWFAFAVILHPEPSLEEPWSSVLHFPALAAISYQDLADRSCHYDALCSEIPTPQHQIQPQKHKKPWFISYFLAVVQALTSGQQSFCSATRCKGCRQKLLQTNLLSRRPQWQLLVEGWVRTVAWLWHTVTFYLESWLGNHPPFESLRIQIRPENESASVSVKTSRRGRAKHPLFWSRFRILAFCEVSLPRRKSSRLVMMSSFPFVCSPYDFPNAFKFKCHGFLLCIE